MYLVAFFFLFSLNNQQNHHHHHHHHHFHSSVKGTGTRREEEGRKGGREEGTKREDITGCVGVLSTSHTLGGCWRWWCRSRRQTPPGCFLYPWRRSCDSRFPYLESDSCSRTVLGCKLLHPHRCWVLERARRETESNRDDTVQPQQQQQQLPDFTECQIPTFPRYYWWNLLSFFGKDTLCVCVLIYKGLLKQKCLIKPHPVTVVARDVND